MRQNKYLYLSDIFSILGKKTILLDNLIEGSVFICTKIYKKIYTL